MRPPRGPACKLVRGTARIVQRKVRRAARAARSTPRARIAPLAGGAAIGGALAMQDIRIATAVGGAFVGAELVNRAINAGGK